MPPVADSRDHLEAHRIAERAGEALLALRARQTLTGAQLGAEGDRISHQLILEALRAQFPDDAVLSEEAAEASTARLGAVRTWIVDPLDGTREYGEPGREDWAVHVALVIAEEPVAGAVALPARAKVLSTYAAPRVGARANEPLRMVVSRTRPSPETGRLQRLLGAAPVPMGSAGAKAMAVALGEAELYVHSGGQYEWDSAAPVAVARAAGLHASRISGEPLRYNQPNPYLPDLVVCRPELAERVLAALRQKD